MADASVKACRAYTLHNTGILLRKYAIDLRKEIFRKSIHICTIFVPFALSKLYWPVIIGLSCVLFFYVIAEILRTKGIEVPVISEITAAAARKRDENRFVLGPVTLCLGVLLTALLFNPKAASIGIYALAAGDGLASLTGKMFGRLKIPFTGGKSVVGSLTCFFVIFLLSFVVCKNTFMALILGVAGMIAEMLPLKDFDNILIPVLLAAISQFVFFC